MDGAVGERSECGAWTADSQEQPDLQTLLHHDYKQDWQVTYTATIRQDGGRWIGWIEEITGVNCPGETREELMENLSAALQ